MLKPKLKNFMRYFILLLFCLPMLIYFYHKNIQKPNIDKSNIVNESLYTVEGTITKITFTDLSKTSRVKRLAMHLYLQTSDSPDKELKFRRYPALESDQQLRVGQRISLTAIKDDFPDFIEDEF